MQKRLARAVDLVTRFVRESAWAPLVGRALAIAAGMALLAAIGAGWLDRSLDLGPPRAEAATGARSARAPRPRPPASAPAPSASAPDAASRHAPPSATAKVILNTATEQELERLPGVGPAKAKAIAALRTKLGGKFRRFEDLLRVRGIGRRSLARIREHAVLDPPPPEEVPPPAPVSP